MLKSLSTLIAVHECNSIRRAAETLHTDPTAVSRKIRQLEYEFGTALIERSSRGVRLTDAGQLLVEQANLTLRDLNMVRHKIADLVGLETGQVTIYAAEATVGGFLAPVLADFCKAYPKVTVRIALSGADGAHSALRTGDADIGVTLFAESRPDIETVRKMEFQNVAICAPDHPLADLKACRMSDLVRHNVALPEASFGARQSFERSLKKAGLDYDCQFTTSSVTVQRSLARAGISVMILPDIGLNHDVEFSELVRVPIVEPGFSAVPIEIATNKHRTTTFAARRCLDLISARLRELGEPP
ncbi:MAG: LysR family transcriptional regulator [Pseudomonadota bacterium]|nr:LysR family transcriptional regulator [Pseudomonadota bacterium]